MRKNICVLTSTRAEYGLLKNLIKKLLKINEYDIQVIVTGMHLSPEFGFTYKEIEEDSIVIDEKIEILLSADTASAVSKSMGVAMIGFSDYFKRRRPDLLIVLGDRYETLAVCTVAMIYRITIAHIHGGETTEGMIDEAIRHSITKMSYLHFTSTEEYKNRVIQLGEQPDRVFNVGALGVENILSMEYMKIQDLERLVGFSLNEKFAMMTFHPVTLENETSKKQFLQIIYALKEYGNLRIIITKANSDTNGRIINQLIDELVKENANQYIAFTSLGTLKYLSLMKYCNFVIGNSSSGIIETPTFKIPTINIGDRQKGRVQAKSIINSKPKKRKIVNAISKAMSEKFNNKLKDINNPYGNGETSDKIIKEIKRYLKEDMLDIKKVFYNYKN